MKNKNQKLDDDPFLDENKPKQRGPETSSHRLAQGSRSTPLASTGFSRFAVDYVCAVRADEIAGARLLVGDIWYIVAPSRGNDLLSSLSAARGGVDCLIDLTAACLEWVS